MDPHLKPPASRYRGHGRSPSNDDRRRVAIPRRSTKGPLDDDIDDPLATSQILSRSRDASPLPSPRPASVISPTTAEARINELQNRDFSTLLRPEAYHGLPPNIVPTPFLSSEIAPPSGTPLPDLLAKGHFRLAAISAALALTTKAAPNDYATIFDLLYIRLACLTLINQTALAAAEATMLGDLSSAFYRHPVIGAHLVSWELRVLAVRLQALGFGDWRKGIMGYYELGRDARIEILRSREARQVAESKIWEARLKELGVLVANALVEMGDLDGANKHLQTLEVGSEVDDEHMKNLVCMQALSWLRTGDILAAKRCLSRLSERKPSTSDSDATVDILSALIQTSDGDFPSSLASWRTLQSTHPSDPLIRTNLAVCLLYTGRIAEARPLLEDLVDQGVSFKTLSFNLATMYELNTERASELKVALAERVAAMEPEGKGWEGNAVDFKL